MSKERANVPLDSVSDFMKLWSTILVTCIVASYYLLRAIGYYGDSYEAVEGFMVFTIVPVQVILLYYLKRKFYRNKYREAHPFLGYFSKTLLVKHKVDILVYVSLYPYLPYFWVTQDTALVYYYSSVYFFVQTIVVCLVLMLTYLSSTSLWNLEEHKV